MAASTAKTSGQALQTTVSLLQDLFGSIQQYDFAVRLWDGSMWRPNGETQEPARFTIVLQHPGALRKMFLPPNDLTLGEAYIYNDFDIEGDIEAVFQLAEQFTSNRWGSWNKYVLANDCSAFRIRARPDTQMHLQNCVAHGTRKSEIGRLWPIITTDRMNFMLCGWTHKWSTLAHIS